MRELIEKLRQMPQEANVYVQGEYDDETVTEVRLEFAHVSSAEEVFIGWEDIPA